MATLVLAVLAAATWPVSSCIGLLLVDAKKLS
jgi:hypothetical protein